MKRILTLLLGFSLVCQPIHAMEKAEPTVSDALYALAGHTGSFLWNSARFATACACTAAGFVVAKTAPITIPAAVLYAGYWLATAKTRQDLKDIKNLLEPTNPLKQLGQGNLICHWNVRDYPTAGDLAAIGRDGSRVNTFLIDLAQGFINNKFKNVAQPDDIKDKKGWDLVNAARQIMFKQIEAERKALKILLKSLRAIGSLEYAEKKLKAPLSPNSNKDRAVPGGWLFDYKKKFRNYVSFEGYPIKQRLGLGKLTGLAGNNFAFDYADEFKEACQKAGLEISTPSEMTPAQYKIVDDYMTECAKTSNNKIKFLRGNMHYAQAARLYWNAYKKYHRLQVIEALLNNVDKQLVYNPSQWNPNIVYHFNLR